MVRSHHGHSVALISHPLSLMRDLQLDRLAAGEQGYSNVYQRCWQGCCEACRFAVHIVSV